MASSQGRMLAKHELVITFCMLTFLFNLDKIMCIVLDYDGRFHDWKCLLRETCGCSRVCDILKEFEHAAGVQRLE